MVRDEIPRYSVDLHFLIRPGIGYLHISGFQETTEAETTAALDEMGELKGLILDLRNNPGGLLSEGVGVADKFLKKGQVIVSHHGRNSPEKVYRAAHGSTQDYPIVVLVNHGTASAAEIVSGAIQDHDRGLIAGETTFGKGLVQTVYRLSENTGLALTTAKYYTPSGRLIQRDYNGVSLYDYYYNRNADDNSINGVKQDDANREVKLTDSGRTVYGGGGITPDVKIAPIKANKFQEELLRKYAFFNFSKHYSISHKIEKSFQVDDGVLQEFRTFLTDAKIALHRKGFGGEQRVGPLQHQERTFRGRVRAAGGNAGAGRGRPQRAEGPGTDAQGQGPGRQRAQDHCRAQPGAAGCNHQLTREVLRKRRGRRCGRPFPWPLSDLPLYRYR